MKSYLNRFIFTGFLALFSVLSLSAQTRSSHLRAIDDQGTEGIRVTWQFDGPTFHQVSVEGKPYQFVRLEDFTHTKEVGKPALPTTNELIAIPAGASVKISITRSEFQDIQLRVPVHPALQPATDTYGAAEPLFEIDEAFYRQDRMYPGEPVALEGTHFVREISFGVFNINPVQYNPAKGILRVYRLLEFEVTFSGGGAFL
ncbi:MAG TPA: C25 family peptidase propeptide domain-containing protein, partial [Bacteroidales bacterium]|nr:C25 family peptidase propeptide domain-containing protein [Bacteroidales bacterium]